VINTELFNKSVKSIQQIKTCVLVNFQRRQRLKKSSCELFFAAVSAIVLLFRSISNATTPPNLRNITWTPIFTSISAIAINKTDQRNRYCRFAYRLWQMSVQIELRIRYCAG
jgi:hypothetical protein